MGMVAYTLIGLLVGTLVKKWGRSHSDKTEGLFGTNVLSVVGAVTGGWSWNLLLGNGHPTGLDLSSVFAATLGALLTLSILYVIHH